ncbi:nuclear transport factor 2 family protein [Pseudooceanicola sp. 216_PA32_1]|uniref:Nuclear transport factor 2 family protein n=1 Tax=Pseudooceanicola pacificus TaxID=2676438 RepID=A0A844WEQ6_9RHOB|nr:nuclear transport factor 2 family protein [Pseudooceanicola pacificus]MWB77599.1 nuclear transport factor 2 family protein [Pseudooceanicola pacificus]
MTPAENKSLMRRIFKRLAEGDGSLYIAHLADDATMTVTGRYSWSRTFHGKQEILTELYGHLRKVVTGSGRTVPIRFLADEDWVVVEAQGQMTAIDGTPYENEYCLMYRLSEGMIVEAREYQDSALCEAVLGPFPGADGEAGV